MSFSKDELAVIRRAYAKQILAAAGIADEDLEHAFTAERREHYLGPPPWFLARYDGYYEIPSSDPAVLYQDCVLSIQQERNVNNGSPALHAWALHSLQINRGNSVAHIGCGTGYYTSILSKLTGDSGLVTAIEFDPVLADSAGRNLRDNGNIRVIQGDGCVWPQVPVDRIYVNFASSRPAKSWIENLRVGGKLIFPLGLPIEQSQNKRSKAAKGIFLFVQREPSGYKASSLGPTYFVWGEGSHDETAIHYNRKKYLKQLQDSIETKKADRIRSLRLGKAKTSDEWFSGDDWGLSYEPLSKSSSADFY
ncbi:methyltransferase domain-containing protein [Sinorhizobium meliloti]|uniref:protein-L-isoaspartate O-methyltransferase family protein n=1 Tax=Rhizobium meliloti TaxID=382 RepID=UPI00048022EE|nr:methyltransferase domain-containing protein [Sinorhizobium meliloti]MDW9354599.1 methyltransferase domain-containing protein [Sinorhizobium meliloti]MDW9653240.1 methyltransferase domain-containing protein [Sinorhizobium meliloti]MDW9763854.1 methyltransferase domain-containing protein [Sinorhizobium meliloti]MDW9913204.1 methyltransferase domain-containing protein [Sinorhizobium meliloti]MDW9940042.1 methyltransferase domain-containing protein [Sinorhizobium meliloti]